MSEQGWIVWLTGLPAAGKTTTGRSMQAQLRCLGSAVILLDSDELRQILPPQPTYHCAERVTFYDQLGQVALLIARQNINVSNEFVPECTGHLARGRTDHKWETQFHQLPIKAGGIFFHNRHQ